MKSYQTVEGGFEGLQGSASEPEEDQPDGVCDDAGSEGIAQPVAHEVNPGDGYQHMEDQHDAGINTVPHDHDHAEEHGLDRVAAGHRAIFLLHPEPLGLPYFFNEVGSRPE